MPFEMPRRNNDFLNQNKVSMFAKSNNDLLSRSLGGVFKNITKTSDKIGVEGLKKLDSLNKIFTNTNSILQNQLKVSEVLLKENKEIYKVLEHTNKINVQSLKTLETQSKILVDLSKKIIGTHYKTPTLSKDIPFFERQDDKKKYKNAIYSIPEMIKKQKEQDKEHHEETKKGMGGMMKGMFGWIFGPMIAGLKTLAIGGLVGYMLFGKGEFITKLRSGLVEGMSKAWGFLSGWFDDNKDKIYEIGGKILKGIGEAIWENKWTIAKVLGTMLVFLKGPGILAKATPIVAKKAAPIVAKAAPAIVKTAAALAGPVTIGIGGGLIANELLYRGLGGKKQERIRKEEEELTRQENLKSQKIRELMSRRDRGEIDQDQMMTLVREVQMGGDSPQVMTVTSQGSYAFGKSGDRSIKLERSDGEDSGETLISRGINTVRRMFGGKTHKTYNKSDGSVVKYLGYGTTPNMDGLNHDVLHNFLGMSKEYHRRTGNPIQVNSAYRPGKTGAHGAGFAIDIQSAHANQLERMGLMERWGFHRPLIKWASEYDGPKDEPWHIEPYPGREHYGTARNTLSAPGQEYRLGIMAGGEHHIKTRNEIGGDDFNNLPNVDIPDRVNVKTPVNVILSEKDIEKLALAIGKSFRDALPNGRQDTHIVTPNLSRLN